MNYFHGCRKDAKCNCELCLASIIATLDLMPLSLQRSYLTKLSSTPISKTPVPPFSPYVLSTPGSRVSPVVMAKSNKKLRFEGDVKKGEKGEVGFAGVVMRKLFFGFCLVFLLEFGFSWVVSRGLRTELSNDLVRNLGEESWGLRDLNERFAYLSNGIKGLIGDKNLNGSFVDDTWEINQFPRYPNGIASLSLNHGGHLLAVASSYTYQEANEIYTFRCHPKKKSGRTYPVTVNDIAFIPFISGAFVTGDNEGYVIVWNAHSKRRLLEFPRYPNGIASLSLNHGGHLLAVASSYTYQEANEIEESPQIFIQNLMTVTFNHMLLEIPNRICYHHIIMVQRKMNIQTPPPPPQPQEYLLQLIIEE